MAPDVADDDAMSDERVTATRIVVGTDGSPRATKAVHWAAEEAVRRHAVLEVVDAWLPPYPIGGHDLFTDYGPIERAAQAQVTAVAERLRKELPELSGVAVSTPMEHAAAALVRIASGADLLVVGARGHGGFASLLLGSVSEHCLTHAPCSVAVVPETSSDNPVGCVVVGVDGSPSSERALEWAAHEAVLRRARLDVIHTRDVPALVIPTSLVGGADAAQQDSRAMLERVTRGLKDQLGEVPEMELRPVAGPTVPTLLEAAGQADLLVVGARGLGAVRGWLLGSVSRQCAQHAPCPTVVVRHPSTEAQP